MSWNHRVLRYKEKLSLTSEEEGFLYRIEEVYYDGEGNPTSWTESKRFLADLEDMDSLRWEYDALRKAFEKPILEIQGNKLVPVPEEDDV